MTRADCAPIGQAEDYSGGRIERIDLATGAVEVLSRESDRGSLKGPNDLVFDGEGGFYFTDLGKVRERDQDRGAVYYARADGSSIREVVFPMFTPNGIGLSPDGRVLYVAETETARLWAFDLVRPGEIAKHPFPSPHGGRIVTGLAGYNPFELACRRCGRQHLRGDAGQRRNHGGVAGRQVGPSHPDARALGDEHLLRRYRPEDGLYHTVLYRAPRCDALGWTWLAAPSPQSQGGALINSEERSMKQALVAGGLGVAGQGIVQHLSSQPDWKVYALSRRVPEVPGTASYLSIDLLNREDVERKLAGLTGITHVFYTAYQEKPTFAEEVQPNLAMLRNVVEVVAGVSPALEHINLMQKGPRRIGTHLGPYKTPARETDPRHMPPISITTRRISCASLARVAAGAGPR